MKAHVFFLIIIVAMIVNSCSQNRNSNTDETNASMLPDSVYVARGNAIIAHTFDTLRNSLLHAIREKGIDEAIGFCNERAFDLTNLYSDGVTLKRTSNRVRNDSNSPNEVEESVLNEMSNSISSGKTPQTKIMKLDGQVHFFKPILLQPMCLNCHGDPATEIQPSTLAKVQELYPNDKATGFKVGDLRGIWHLVFKGSN